MKVSSLAIVYSIISIVLSAILPLAVMIFLFIKKKLSMKAVLVGVFMYFIFVDILEPMLHYFVLGADYQNSFLYKSPIAFMLYGGLVAGIFEETARLVGFKYLLKIKKGDSFFTGASYGLGHGGFESVYVGGIAALNNLIISFMINSGSVAKMLSTVDAQQAEDINKTVNTMVTLPDYNFLLIGIERSAGLIMQASLSLMVFKAVKEKQWKYFIYAVILHTVVYFPIALAQRGVLESQIIAEMLVVFLASVCAFIAYRIYWPQGNSDLGQLFKKSN